MVHGLWTRLTQDLDSTSSMHKKVLLFMPLDFSTFVFTAAGVFGVEMSLLLFPLWTFLPLFSQELVSLGWRCSCYDFPFGIYHLCFHRSWCLWSGDVPVNISPLEFFTFVFTGAGVFGVEMFLLTFPLWNFSPLFSQELVSLEWRCSC